MQRILISACLLGQAVRYDAGHKQLQNAILQGWLDEGRVLALCPEVAAGLPIPRPPAEISAAQDGSMVLRRQAQVIEQSGGDVSAQFIAGAEQALRLAQNHGIKLAVLKEGSPSCGSTHIFDGSFSGQQIAGAGVTAALLRQHGIAVFSELQLADAERYLQQLGEDN